MEGRRLLSASVSTSSSLTQADPLAVPALNSRPSATKQLFLDFNGAAGFDWSGTWVPATPAFSRDHDATSFSATDVAAIKTIWQAVADKYSPFDINVTTVSPGTLEDGVSSAIILGGQGEWYGQDGDGRYFGGVAYRRSFYTPLDNHGFVFEQNFGTLSDIATAAAHEAGHTFGLDHHRSFDSQGNLVAEYADGPSDSSNSGYIMGQPGYGRRMLWANVTGGEYGQAQNDLTLLGNVLGLVPDAEGDLRATSVALTHTGNTLSSNGFTHLIQTTTDKDYFRFTTNGGVVDLSGVTPEGGMLDFSMELRNASGVVVASDSGLEKPFIRETHKRIVTTLAAGTYYVMIKSAGGFGNIGLYSITGTEGGNTQELSKGRTYSASSTYAVAGYEAQSAGDKSLNTRWRSAWPSSAPQWLKVDLGRVSTINEVDLTWGEGYATAYQLQASDDGQTWRTLYSTTSGGSSVEERINGLNASGRYVRMLSSAHNDAGVIEIYEFAIYGTSLTSATPASTGQISGYAFNDSNRNGTYDGTDTLAAGKTIWLDLDNDGVKDTSEPSTVTATNGTFAFTNVAAGTYHVRRLFPAGYTESTAPRLITLTAGQSVTNVAIGSKTV
jgi:hypothetical protein